MTESILYKKLALVLGKIKRISEDGRNKEQGYRYATDEAVYDMVRAALSEEGLAVIASLKSVEAVGMASFKSLDVSPEKKVRATFIFTLVCGESGETYPVEWVAEAFNTDDKAINKCATAAMKYWLKTTFLIGMGNPADDPDGDAPPRETQRPNTAPKTPPTAKDNPNFAPAPASNGGLTYADGQEIIRIGRNVYQLDDRQVCQILNVTKLGDFKQNKAAALKILEAAYSSVMGHDEPLKDNGDKTEPPAAGETIQPTLVTTPEPTPEPPPAAPRGSFPKPKLANGDTERTPADVFAELHERRAKSRFLPQTLKAIAERMGEKDGKAAALARYFNQRGWKDEHRHLLYERAWGKSKGDELTEQEWGATKEWLLSDMHTHDPEMMLEWAKGEVAAPAPVQSFVEAEAEAK